VGSEEISIKVEAGAFPTNATSAEISTTVNSRQIQNLPLDGRDPLDLILLQAGTSSSKNQNTSINGQRTSFTNITQDGINIQDAFLRSNATDFSPSLPAVDDTEEFTITTQNSGADQGYGSAQIRLVTPHGTDEFHGGLWLYNRNSAYGANDFFNNKAGIDKPFRNRNQFGLKFGGPVPGLEGRLFFFAHYEGLRDSIKSSTNRTLLLPDAREGIFTYTDGSNLIREIDLLSLVPEITEVDPIVDSRFLSKMPLSGNRSDIGDQLNTTGITLNQPADTDRDLFMARGDSELKEGHKLSLIFSWSKESNQRPDLNNTEGFDEVHPITQSLNNKQIVAAYQWFKSPGFSNEIRGGIIASKVRFTRTGDIPSFFMVPFAPQTTAANQFISNPEVTFLDQGRKTYTYNLQNNSEKLMHSHSLRFGAQMQMFQVDPYNDANIVPTFYMGTNTNTPTLTAGMFPGGISATQLNNANSLFSILGGILSSGTQSFNVKDKNSGFQAIPKFEDYRYSNYSLYLTDQWRVTPDLILNLGIRYELITPARLLNGLGLEPVIADGTDPIEAILDPDGSYDYIGGNAGGSNKLYKTDWNNIGPVVSFAYHPRPHNSILRAILGKETDRFVIRGGYRQSYVNDSNLTAARFAISGNAGLGTTAVTALNPLTGTPQLNARPSDLPTITPPPVNVPRTFVQNNGPSFSNFGIVFAIDPDIQTTRIHEYTLGIQRPIGWGTVIEIRYAGSRSNNLWRTADYNQIDIRQNGFAEDFNRARRNLLANSDPSVGESLTVFPLLANGGLLSNPAVQAYLQNGATADLAFIYIVLGLTGSVNFLPNPNIGVADFLNNGARYRYDSMQVDVRKQFSDSFYFQANYTWQKTLTNAIGTSQTLVDPYLDLENPQLEYTRADYDMTHIFNFNSMYGLPIGNKEKFLNRLPAWADHLLGGWQLNTIVRATSGTPITIVDPRGTLNRAGRSSRQTPNTLITNDQLKALSGHFENSNGIYFINPSIINQATGRAAEGYGTAPFPGQVLFNVPPGQTGSIGRALMDGPGYINVNAALVKDIRFSDQSSLQLRLEAFNVFNHTNFYLSNQLQDINSTTFGKLLNAWDPREIQIAAKLKF
jgi:hypothetical protein